MLISFTVSNYRSIKDKVELRTCAQFRKGRSDPNQPGYYSKSWKMRLLPAVAIFGPNDAGKSNIVNALADFLDVAYRGAISADSQVKERIVPYRLDSAFQNRPTAFEGVFLINEKQYRYALEFVGGEVVREEYGITPTRTSDEYLLFRRSRASKDAAHDWAWGGRGKYSLHAEHRALVNNLKTDRTFLSVIVGAFSLPATADFYSFLKNNPVPVNAENVRYHRMHVMTLAKDNPKFLKALEQLLKTFDIPVKSLKFSEKSLRVVRAGSGSREAEFSIMDESEGTRQLIILSETILHGLSSGGIVIVDELDAHLHPFISHLIVQIFQSPIANTRGAQLIFTTHDTSLMDLELLRKEQIYLAMQQLGEGTQLESIVEYKLRNQLALARSYMDGRLSGLPKLGYEREIANEIKTLVLSNGARYQ